MCMYDCNVYVCTYTYQRFVRQVICTTLISFLVQKIFDRLIQSLPTNSYCVACQIHKNSKFADVFIENDDVLTNCEDQRVVNGYLLWYMYRKCGYDILEFKHAFESTFICQKILPSTDAKYQLLECKKG